jgi:site-specific recombinase XerC
MTTSIGTIRRSGNAKRTDGPETLIGFLLALRAAGRSPKTEQKYRESVLLLAEFAKDMGMPPVENLTAEHLRHYLMSLYDKGNRPGTVSTRYRSLQAYYKWLVEEGEIRESPISRI